MAKLNYYLTANKGNLEILIFEFGLNIINDIFGKIIINLCNPSYVRGGSHIQNKHAYAYS
jgi:hypothetical protein